METKHFQGPGFVMEVPTDWFISSSPQFQAVFLSPPTADGLRANLTVSMRPVEADVTVLAVAQATGEAQAAEYPQYEVLEEIDYTQQGGSGFLRRYRWRNDDGPLVQTQAFFLVAQMLFTLTGTARDTIADDAQPIFNAMIDSFRV